LTPLQYCKHIKRKSCKELATDWPLITKTVNFWGWETEDTFIGDFYNMEPCLNLRKGGNLQKPSLYNTLVLKQILDLKEWLKIGLHTSQHMYSHRDEIRHKQGSKKLAQRRNPYTSALLLKKFGKDV
jgi:hypothetical protein